MFIFLIIGYGKSIVLASYQNKGPIHTSIKIPSLSKNVLKKYCECYYFPESLINTYINVGITCFGLPQQAWQMQSWTSRQVMLGHPLPSPCSARPCVKMALLCWKADPARSSRCPPPRPASTATLRSESPEVLWHWWPNLSSKMFSS